MKKVKNPSKSKTTSKARVVAQETPAKESVSFGRVLTLIFKVITLPFYMVYVLLFKVPTDGPAPIVGFLRFALFITLSILMTQTRHFQHSIEGFVNSYDWVPVSATTILGVVGLVMLLNLFLSFMEIFGFSTTNNSHFTLEDSYEGASSEYDAIEEGIDYRDSLLRAKHTPGKLEELKKTGFITKERLFGLNSSPEVSEALGLLNSQMRAMHEPGKLKALEGVFAGK